VACQSSVIWSGLLRCLLKRRSAADRFSARRPPRWEKDRQPPADFRLAKVGGESSVLGKIGNRADPVNCFPGCLFRFPIRGSGRPGRWSGKRDSNPRPSAWKADALPLSYSRPGASAIIVGHAAWRKPHHHKELKDSKYRGRSRLLAPQSGAPARGFSPFRGTPGKANFYFSNTFRMGRGGFEPPKASPADLQSAPFDRSGTSPEKLSASLGGPRTGWSWREDSNPQPPHYK
jgi:hypothetical protein